MRARYKHVMYITIHWAVLSHSVDFWFFIAGSDTTPAGDLVGLSGNRIETRKGRHFILASWEEVTFKQLVSNTSIG